jgi:EF hand
MRNRLAIAAALLLASCTAMGSGVPRFSKLDADSDAKISREEAAKSPELMLIFDSADTNGDGFLDDTEFQRTWELIRERDGADDSEQDRGHQRRQH